MALLQLPTIQGEARVTSWQTNGGSLPAETRNYVMIVTGTPVESWLSGSIEAVDYTLQPEQTFLDSCIAMAKTGPVPTIVAASADWRPWGVLLAQDFSPGNALAMFKKAQDRFASVIADEPMLMLTVRNPSFGRKARHSAMIGRASRGEAEKLCNDLRSAGGSCVVVKN